MMMMMAILRPGPDVQVVSVTPGMSRLVTRDTALQATDTHLPRGASLNNPHTTARERLVSDDHTSGHLKTDVWGNYSVVLNNFLCV